MTLSLRITVQRKKCSIDRCHSLTQMLEPVKHKDGEPSESTDNNGKANTELEPRQEITMTKNRIYVQ